MMNVDVYDTHVRTVEGNLLHFDIMLPSDEESRVIYYANQWLLGIVKIPEKITRENCRYRHTETATPEIRKRIREHGYFIIQMEGCPAFYY
jgi:hypothetical protein